VKEKKNKNLCYDCSEYAHHGSWACDSCEYEMAKKYRCPRCGYEQTFDEAYLDSGRYCPNCDAELNIPFEFWIGD